MVGSRSNWAFTKRKYLFLTVIISWSPRGIHGPRGHCVTFMLTPPDIEKRVTRSKGDYNPYPNYGSKFLNSYFPYISKMWNNLEKATQCLSLLDFKSKLKSDLKPNKIKHYSKGSKVGNMLLTRIRLDKSELKLHKFTVRYTTMSLSCKTRVIFTFHDRLFLLLC